MTDADLDLGAQNTGASAWWTPRRTRLAGLGALVGGVGGLLGSLGGLGLAGLSLGDADVGLTQGTVVVIYPVVHTEPAVAR